ncbi:MAG: hypothetical protein ABIK09_19980 [Pseudomonadota bacterium]
MSLVWLLVFGLVGCDGGANKDDPPPADTVDTVLVFDTLPPQDTAPPVDLPKGWTMKKDLHKEE